MTSQCRRLRVRVPASTSNIGPGFDILGCAFQLYNVFDVELGDGDAGQSTIEFHGPRCAGLRPSPRNIFFQAADRLYQRIGQTRPAMKVRCEVNVPNARGLGSSSTAIAAALVAANEFAGAPLTRQELVELASAIEGHPDNVVPAILGGLSASLYDPQSGHVMTRRVMPHASVRFLVFVPDYEVPTSEARSVLPREVPLGDAVANAARIPLLLQALIDGDLADMRILTQDRWHEPHRAPLYRGLDELRAAAFDAGAASMTVSGAGPTMLAIAGSGETAKAIDAAWTDAAREMELPGACLMVSADAEGSVIIGA